MTDLFKVSTTADVGDNWTIAWFGQDRDGIDYYVTTNSVHASDLSEVSGGAKADAELVAKLLNEYYARQK